MEERNDEIAEFSPTKHGLLDTFRLTDYANLKGWGCKVPQKVLLKLLEGLQKNEGKHAKASQSTEPRIGISANVMYTVLAAGVPKFKDSGPAVSNSKSKSKHTANPDPDPIPNQIIYSSSLLRSGR